MLFPVALPGTTLLKMHLALLDDKLKTIDNMKCVKDVTDEIKSLKDSVAKWKLGYVPRNVALDVENLVKMPNVEKTSEANESAKQIDLRKDKNLEPKLQPIYSQTIFLGLGQYRELFDTRYLGAARIFESKAFGLCISVDSQEESYLILKDSIQVSRVINGDYDFFHNFIEERVHGLGMIMVGNVQYNLQCIIMCR